MTDPRTAEAAAALDALTGDMPDEDHDAADEILLRCVPLKFQPLTAA